jgi:hypothetical protein
MAVVTAIATANVGAIGISGIAATIATSIISAGLALGTAKALGVMEPPKQQETKDPGVKIQLPPSTDNRIPVFYGQSFTGAIIVDAEIKNQNNTMVYCMVIGEKTDSGVITVNDIYRDDSKLIFSGATVTSATDPNATTSTNINGKIRCRVYAGGTAATDQIFPLAASGQVAATTLMTTINATTNYANLVYSVIEMDYDAENGLQGLGAITYDINNSLNEPSNVLLDYLQNDRYGAGISSSDIDTSSFNDLYDYATAQVDYRTNPGNITAQHNRWQIDGMLSTYQPVKRNINELCRSCAAYFAYDPKQGKFRIISNRAATTAEKNAAYIFTDDNIVSSIDITSTELYSLYNSIDAEYPSVDKKDQTQTIIVSTPSGERNNNEPDNPLDTRFNLVNDRSRVGNLANIDLNQSRTSTVITFTADYSSIVNDVGDVVKVTSSQYGFTNKLFRVMRVTEVETADAMLGAKFTCIEYTDAIYTHTEYQSDGVVGLSLIPNWWQGLYGTGGNNVPIVGNIIVTDPTTATATTVLPGNGNPIAGTIPFSGIDWPNVIIAGQGGQGGITTTPETPMALVPVTIPNTPGLDQIEIDVETSATGNPSVTTTTKMLVPNPFGGMWRPGEIPVIAIPLPENPTAEKSDGTQLPNLPNNDEPLYNLKVFGHGIGNGGRYSTLPSAIVPDILLPNKGGVPGAALAGQAVGISIDEAPASVNMPFGGLLQYTAKGIQNGTTMTFNESGVDNLIVDGTVTGSGVPSGTVITAVTGPGANIVTVNNSVLVANGTAIDVDNTDAVELGNPGSFLTPAVTTNLGGATLGKYGLKSDFQPFGTLPAGGGQTQFAMSNLINYTEVTIATNEPTGTTISETQNTPSVIANFNQLPPAVIVNDLLTIDEARGLAAAIASGATTTGKRYIPKTLTQQPLASSTLYPNTKGKPNYTTERFNGGDAFRDLF